MTTPEPSEPGSVHCPPVATPARHPIGGRHRPACQCVLPGVARPARGRSGRARRGRPGARCPDAPEHAADAPLAPMHRPAPRCLGATPGPLPTAASGTRPRPGSVAPSVDPIDADPAIHRPSPTTGAAPAHCERAVLRAGAPSGPRRAADAGGDHGRLAELVGGLDLGLVPRALSPDARIRPRRTPPIRDRLSRAAGARRRPPRHVPIPRVTRTSRPMPSARRVDARRRSATTS